MKTQNILHSLLSILLGIYCTFASAADLEAGKQKAALCFGCHGQDGNSTNPQWPRLAGQQPAYLSNQLTAFRNGQRKNATMQGMAAALSDEDINNLAAYFGSLTPKSAGGDEKLAAQGKKKFSMCTGCHGASAEGRGMFPRLAGQHTAYIAKQLRSFREGKRISGPMQANAGNLTDDDINAISAYLGTLK